jgi:hypothetical protein
MVIADGNGGVIACLGPLLPNLTAAASHGHVFYFSGADGGKIPLTI